VKQSRYQITSHTLTEAKQSNGGVQQRLNTESFDKFVASLLIFSRVDSIDVSEQIKRFDHGQISP
jgi:hypothetical protein